MNNKPLPSRFSVTPLALLIPIASLAILSSTASAQSASVIFGTETGAITTETYSFLASGSAVSSVTVTNSGTIGALSSSGTALTIANNATVPGGIENAGLIAGGTYSGFGIDILVADGASVGSITNTGAIGFSETGSGSSSSSFSPALAFKLDYASAASITNSGTINGSIELVGDAEVTGAINNSGSIVGGISAAIGTPTTGGTGMPTIGSVANSGTITEGLFFEGANVGAITNASGGLINRNTSNLGGIYLSGGTAQSITNDGLIDAAGNTEILAGGRGIDLDEAQVGAVVNNGTISAGASSASQAGIGIALFDATVTSITNNGLIEVTSTRVSPGGGAGQGIFVGAASEVGSISNTGTITVSSFSGSNSSDVGAINLGSDAIVGSISNSGVIEGDIGIKNGAEVTGTVNNSGLIDGEIYIAAHESSPGPSSIGSLINSGTITAGLFVENSEIKGNVANTAGGEIRDGIAFDRSSFGGDLTNAGLITSAFDGEGLDAIPATISINGDILNTEVPMPPAVIALQGQIVNTGSITNTAAAATLLTEPLPIEPPPLGPAKPSAGVSDPAAIYLNYVNMADGIYNDGLISSTAGTAIRLENSNLNVISNTGTITGGNTYAIFIDDTAEVKQIDNSGVINGIVDFGAKGGLYKSTGGTSGAVVNATSLQVGAATAGVAGPLVSTINGNFTFSGPMTFDANGFDGGVRYGQLDVSGNATVTGALNINVTGQTFFANSEVLELINAGGGLTTAIDAAEDNSLLLDFTISTDTNSLFATVVREEVVSVVEDLFSLANVASELGAEIANEFGVDLTSAGATNTLAIAASLDLITELVESGDIPESSALGQTLALLQGIDDPVLLVQAIQSLEAESGGAGSEGSKAAAGAVSAVIANRQASLRNSAYETGMVAGDDISITGFWIQGYDKDTEQEVREGIDGYDVDMYGIALGADAPVGERTTVGVAISYADSQVDSTGIENNQMGIDSYQISSYVSFNEDDYYLDALVSYSRNEYDGKRNLFNGLTATSDYAGDQYAARARGGYPFVLSSGVHITPNTSIEYSYLKEEGYSEEGAGNSGLEIDSQSLEALVWAAGVKVAYPFTTESDTTWMPDFHIEVRHDFIGDEVELDTNFVGVGGAGFSTNGASVETTAYKAGIGLRAWSQSSVSFMFRYDYTYKKDYNSQAVAATMRYSF